MLDLFVHLVNLTNIKKIFKRKAKNTLELKNSYYIFMRFNVPQCLLSYIEFIFNIKNNSIYISERIRKAFVLF